MTIASIKDILSGKWVRSESPVLEPGEKNDWDGAGAITPGVFKHPEHTGYGMFYTGQASTDGNWMIGYAESEDLLNWRKYYRNPVLSGVSQRSFCQLDGPCLVRQDNEFYLFCEAKEVNKLDFKIRSLVPAGLKGVLRKFRGWRETAQAVSHAQDRYFVRFASRNMLDWDMNAGEVVFRSSGSPGTFDANGIFSPQVYRIDGLNYLIYGGSDGVQAATGMAVSRDLINWERTDYSPILLPGGKGQWDEKNALIVSILKTDDGYLGFYEGEDGEGVYRIGLAYSHDLRHWEKFEGNPIVDITYAEKMVCSPHIFHAKGMLMLFHSSHGKDMRGSCKMVIWSMQ